MILLVVLLAVAVAAPAGAQTFTYRGFAEVRTALYPQTTSQDADRASVAGRIRFEPAYRPSRWLTLEGSIDGRRDSQHLVDREWRLDRRDRGLQRPAVALRHAEARLRHGSLTLDAGKQFVRWGRTDLLNPTDRFAPRDFVEVTDDEFLAVTGARLQFERGAHLVDVVWIPYFTPSRIPIAGNRWAVPPPQTLVGVGVIDLGTTFPERSQFGARWNVRETRYEMALSYFDGLDHLPLFTVQPVQLPPQVPPEGLLLPDADAPAPVTPTLLAVQRMYAPLRMAGLDAAVPLRWVTLKAEAAWLSSSSAASDERVAYVIQLERQSGEFSVVAGYAGEVLINEGSAFDFAPDRGLARALLGRAAYTLGPRRDMSVEAVVRQDFDGVWVKGEFTEAVRSHWRWTVAAVIIGGVPTDFIGQYHRNSHLLLTLRYSF